MIYFILKNTNSEDSLSCQNTTYFNCFRTCFELAKSRVKRGCVIERQKGAKMAPRPAGCGGDGWCSVVVSIEACGKPFLSKKRLAKKAFFSMGKKALGKKFCFAKRSLNCLQRASGPSSNLGTGLWSVA